MKRAALSASNLHACVLCPGRPKAEEPFGENDTQASSRGTFLHSYFRTKLDRTYLEPNDRDLLANADRLSEQFLEQFRLTFDISETEFFTEEHEITLDGIVPGHPDTVYGWRAGEYVALLDFKTGFKAVEIAQDNYQTAVYAALLWERAPFKVCGVAIISPSAIGPRSTSAVYTAEQMPAVLSEIQRVKDSTDAPGARRVAGDEQCGFCRAKTACEEYKAQFEGPLETMDRGLAVSYLSAEKLERLHVAIQFANKIKDEVSGEMRRRVAAGAMPGWKLQSSGDDVKLNDPLEFFNSLRSACEDIGPTAFDSCREMQWGKLTTLVQAKLKVSEKRAKEIVREVSAPYVTRTPKALRVVREKVARLKEHADTDYSGAPIDGQE